MGHPFTAKEVAELFLKEIVCLHGQTEVTNCCLEAYLCCLPGNKPKQWQTYLVWAEFWLNTNYNASPKMTPFRAVNGQDALLLLKETTIPSKVEEVNRLTQQHDELLEDLRSNSLKAQDQM